MIMLEELLKKPEGKTLEFKENVRSLTNIIKTIVAFANTAGGVIIIGIEDRTKQIIGIENPLEEEERLASAIHDTITPVLLPEIETQTYRDKSIIIVTVPHVTGPYYLKAAGLERGTLMRLGSTNRVVDKHMLTMLHNVAQNISYDEIAFVGRKKANLDWALIKQIFKRVDRQITDQVAETLGILLQQGAQLVPSIGGMLLFGVDRLISFPNAMIRCARFIGPSETTILDTADIESPLPLAIDEALKFIQRNTRLRAEIRGIQRIDVPEYPLIALREALTNAVVHADYSTIGVAITVAIFDNRIEITNPGGLPFGFTLEKALTGASRVRNRVIAKVFYNLKLIEQWGTGCPKIIHECTQMGLKTPCFEEINNQFRVTLYTAPAEDATVHREAWEEKLIATLHKKRKISTQEAAQLWEVTPRTARMRLLKLVNNGILSKLSTALQDPYGVYLLRKG